MQIARRNGPVNYHSDGESRSNQKQDPFLVLDSHSRMLRRYFKDLGNAVQGHCVKLPWRSSRDSHGSFSFVGGAHCRTLFQVISLETELLRHVYGDFVSVGNAVGRRAFNFKLEVIVSRS